MDECYKKTIDRRTLEYSGRGCAAFVIMGVQTTLFMQAVSDDRWREGRPNQKNKAMRNKGETKKNQDKQNNIT